MSELTDVLRSLPAASPFPFGLGECIRLDLGSAAAKDIAGLEGEAFTAALERFVQAGLAQAGARCAAGGYGEERPLYRASPVFRGEGEDRTVHLGIDLWVAAGTPVNAVLPGTVHSVQDNARFGDYGPTVLLSHAAGGRTFYTLYGHLARKGLTVPGASVAAGDRIGFVGTAVVNGGWPPHLHFQVIADLEGRSGDYPGVCARSERVAWLRKCPDPNLLLRIPRLGT